MDISGPERLKMETVDVTATNIEKIARLFPNVITEIEGENGDIQKGIDFDLLRQELSGDYVEGREERYDFTWVGKRQAIIEANRPIQKTMRPCIEESKDWEATKNIYIEGDNLDALKLLQESYLNKVKMIYIDPPYNTGKDFVYNDKFVTDSDEYDEETGAVDEDGNYRFKKKNTRDEGRYHSKWCSMLYPRLKLAHNLLRDDGVIFVSIDDNEVHNLRKIMDEVFGEENFIVCAIWKKKSGGGSDAKYYAIDHEYLLCYAKEIEHVKRLFTDLTDNLKSGYIYKDGNFNVLGPYKRKNLHQTGIDTNRRNLSYAIKCPDGSEVIPPTIWRWEKSTFDKANDEGKIDFVKNASGEWQIYTKMYLYDESGSEYKIKPRSLLLSNGYTRDGNKELINLLDSKYFDYPKPSALLRYLIGIHSLINENDIILDFFAGSSTTAHAVMQLNAEDGGNRKFIMVQLPEGCDEKSEAYKAGFENISEIGKERIRRAGEQIKKGIEEENRQAKLGGEPKPIPDIGFRVFKIDETNMKDIYYSAAEYSQETIEGLVDNVKKGRTDLDLLYQVLINWGLPLDLRHEMEEIDGHTIHIIDTDALIACFESNIPESVMRKIAGKKPLRAVFRDGSFRSSPGKLNIEGIFKTIAPDTKLRVI